MAGVVVLVFISLIWGCYNHEAAMAQPQPRRPAAAVLGKAMNRPSIPPNSRFEIITPRFHKRKYEIACSDTGNPACYVACPANCPNKCLVFCSYCMSFCMCDIFPGTSCGDPRFTGGDGNTFYFHGKKDENFCILSDADLHINAHFIGNHNPELKRDFTWVQALGIRFGDHRLYVGARRAVEWDEDEDHIQITFDGEPVDVGAVKNAAWSWSSSTTTTGNRGGRRKLSVTRLDSVNTVLLELDGVFSITANAVPVTDEDDRIHSYGRKKGDSLVHLDLGFKFHKLTDQVHGVLGQTYRPDYVSKLDIRAKMPIMGGASEYILRAGSGSGIFSTDCKVSRFHSINNSTNNSSSRVSYAS